MKERPIIFSAAMVRSILDGRKTQTRRVMKSQPYTLRTEGFGYPTKAGGFVSLQSEHCLAECPYGKASDGMWVREGTVVHANIREQLCGYVADGAYASEGWEKRMSSIHMRRDHCRITLKVTEVRVQRLQDITAAECEEEGIRIIEGDRVCHAGETKMDDAIFRDAFGKAWNSINGLGSWNNNPWVWAITFKRVTGQ